MRRIRFFQILKNDQPTTNMVTKPLPLEVGFAAPAVLPVALLVKPASGVLSHIHIQRAVVHLLTRDLGVLISAIRLTSLNSFSADHRLGELRENPATL